MATLPVFTPFSAYGRLARPVVRGIGTLTALVSSTSTFNSTYGNQYPVSSDSPSGVQPVQTTYTAALAQTQAGRGDQLLIANDWTTAASLSDISTAETNGVDVMIMQPTVQSTIIANRATAALPATATAALFTVLGRCRVKSITGVVTTVIQTQADNLKLTAIPTDQTNLTNTDLCANLNVSASKVNSMFHITGTLSDALINSATGAFNPQSLDVVVQPGTISATTSATNTGSVKWRVEYVPMEPGAMIIPA